MNNKLNEIKFKLMKINKYSKILKELNSIELNKIKSLKLEK